MAQKEFLFVTPLCQRTPSDLARDADLFIDPSTQISVARERNDQRGWGFAENDFTALDNPPVAPQKRLTAVVLDISLDTVQETFNEAWTCARQAQASSWHWDSLLSDQRHLRLLRGILHQRGLRWRVINLGANHNQKNPVCPKDVCKPENSPHSATIWAASYFPRWVQAMDGNFVPYVWISGYQTKPLYHQSFDHVPDLFWGGYRRGIGLRAYRSNSRFREYAVPELMD